MKRVIFILSLILLTNIIIGQNNIPFPTDSSTWTMDIQTQGMTFPPQTSHQISYFITNGDTLINGNLFTRIGTPYTANYCFIREDSGLVYCKYSLNTVFDTTEFVLYNFNLVQGDTLSLPMAGNPITYHPASVYAIDNVFIGIENHKRIRINSWIPIDFVEGVGALQGLMYLEIPWVDFWGDLTCFSRNDTIQYNSNSSLWYTPGNCWTSTDIDKIKSSSFSIYPNPTYGDIFIKGKNIKKVELFNIYGQKLTESVSPRIELQGYKDGVYLLKLTYLDNSIKNAKIIKKNSH
jgi:hypothetical protein